MKIIRKTAPADTVKLGFGTKLKITGPACMRLSENEEIAVLGRVRMASL